MIYFLKHPTKSAVKIGYAANVEARVESLRSTYGNLKVLNVIDGDTALELRIHKHFQAYRYPKFKGMNGGTEWFYADPVILSFAHNPDVNKLTEVNTGRMTRIAMSVESLTIFNIIKRNQKGFTQDDAFLEFMKANHSDLYNEAVRIATMKRELDELYEGDD